MSDSNGLYDALIDHADRYWAAEEENARRRASRVNLLLTVGVVGIGLGLFKFGTDLMTAEVHAHWAVRLLLIGGLVLFLVSIWNLLNIPFKLTKKPEESDDEEPKPLQEVLKDHALDASFLMRLEDQAFEGLSGDLPKPGTADWVKLNIFIQVYEAADQLTERNAYEKRRINLGRFFFAFGVALILAGLSVYTLFGDGSTTRGVQNAEQEERKSSQVLQADPPPEGARGREYPPEFRREDGEVGSEDSARGQRERRVRQED